VKFGRKPKLSAFQQTEAARRLAKGKESAAQIAQSYQVSRWTIARLGE
jgi:hypothetical protein